MRIKILQEHSVSINESLIVKRYAFTNPGEELRHLVLDSVESLDGNVSIISDDPSNLAFSNMLEQVCLDIGAKGVLASAEGAYANVSREPMAYADIDEKDLDMVNSFLPEICCIMDDAAVIHIGSGFLHMKGSKGEVRVMRNSYRRPLGDGSADVLTIGKPVAAMVIYHGGAGAISMYSGHEEGYEHYVRPKGGSARYQVGRIVVAAPEPEVDEGFVFGSVELDSHGYFLNLDESGRFVPASNLARVYIGRDYLRDRVGIDYDGSRVCLVSDAESKDGEHYTLVRVVNATL